MTLDLLGLSNKYDFNLLQQSLTAYLKATLNVTNVCLVYNVASYYQLRDLGTSCSTFVDMHASEVMKSDGFLSLSQSALTELISRDSFFASEMEIYHGIVRWMKHNRVQSKDLLKVCGWGEKKGTCYSIFLETSTLILFLSILILFYSSLFPLYTHLAGIMYVLQ